MSARSRLVTSASILVLGAIALMLFVRLRQPNHMTASELLMRLPKPPSPKPVSMAYQGTLPTMWHLEHCSAPCWVWGERREYESGWIKLPPDHGFVAGCIWGDDSSWKIQYLDLSRIEEGIIRREERFGYIELPGSVRLRDAIHVYGLLNSPRLYIAVSTQWDLQTGKMKPVGIPPWDED